MVSTRQQKNSAHLKRIDFNHSFKKPIAKTCEEVKTICPDCEPDFYNLQIGGKQSKEFCDFKTPEGKLH